ncbi:MAG: OsmC family protein [Acidimicrobiales bacterium]
MGEVEVDDKVLVIKRIHVRYELRAPPDADRAAIERAHRAHVARCPVARTIGGGVEITTELHVIDDAVS